MDRRTLMLAAASLMAASGRSAAQAFPARPLRYIVPVAAGGGSDFVGRTVGERWSKLLGQSIVVDNIGGGGGAIASQTTAKAAPDGYTVMQGYVSTHATSPATRKLAYDPVKDFTPIGMIGATPNVLVVNPGVSASDVRQFVDLVRAQPGKLSFGSAGIGSLTQLAMVLLEQEATVDLVHVPYRGIAPAFTDLLGGQTQAMFPGLAAALPHIRSGKVRPLAVTGPKRHPALKDVPTMIEAGWKGFDAVQWYGVVGPAGLPPAVLKQLNETLNAVLAQPDLADKLSAEAVEPMPMSPEQFSAYLKADLARWTALARDRKIVADN
jgi:tripartite-type tricarboxylate transporter receptor subunit TctC